jgi:hypothetical protein
MVRGSIRIPTYIAQLEYVNQSRTLRSKGHVPLYGGLCVVLAFMIFAWGTGYKLSLYKSEALACSAPAKVCTRGSDAAKSAVDHVADGHNVVQIPVLVAALFSLDEAAGTCRTRPHRRETAINLSPLRRAPILYLRPPPHEGRFLD